MTRQLSRLFTLLALALLIGSAWADELIGRVVGIADGDTLTVLTAQRQQHLFSVLYDRLLRVGKRPIL